MFYNVENLFDTKDNPLTDDDEFLPSGGRRWTSRRYYSHLQQTAQVIHAIGEWSTPALIGVCEVENDSVLIHLLKWTSLKAQNYKFCITQGNDPRGINNALLFQEDKFKLIEFHSRRIDFTESTKRSRDILHVTGKVITGDTLDVFVCHFPSRSGGELETEPSRLDAAKFLRKLCDSIFSLRTKAHLLIMGDFNDTPFNQSIEIIKQGRKLDEKLFNLFEDLSNPDYDGSHKYRGEWAQLDQMIVCKSWIKFLKSNSPRIFCPSFLLTEDKAHRGVRPFRVYHGYKYEAGYSDHLPIVADFLLPLSD